MKRKKGKHLALWSLKRGEDCQCPSSNLVCAGPNGSQRCTVGRLKGLEDFGKSAVMLYRVVVSCRITCCGHYLISVCYYKNKKKLILQLQVGTCLATQVSRSCGATDQVKLKTNQETNNDRAVLRCNMHSLKNNIPQSRWEQGNLKYDPQLEKMNISCL